MSQTPASQAELNKFVKVVDEFKSKYARLVTPAFRSQVYASGNPELISDYEKAVSRGRLLNSTIETTVGAWAAFKRGYSAVTEKTSTFIGDAIDEIRGWFGYDPAPGLGDGQYSSATPPYDPDADLVGVDFRDLQSPVAFRPVRERRFTGLGGLGAVQIVPAVAIAGIIGSATVLIALMNRIFISVEATRIQKETGVSRAAALTQAEGALPSFGITAAITPAMLILGGVALWMIFQKR